jgi:23S rRNA pseudouridine1911/1915/1917 synthase
MYKDILFFTIENEEVGLRIDKFLDETIEELSRTHIQKLIDSNNILVNNASTKNNYKLRLNDKIEVKIPLDKPYEIKPVDLNLDIVYEDEYVCVVNKPKNLVVHPAAGNYDNTLVHGLLHQIKDLSGIGGVLRPGIVHRIDKDTTGLLMVAKNDLAHESLSTQLMNKTVVRKYVALVYGVIEHEQGRINAPINRSDVDRQKMAVMENGKHAVTNFRVIKRFKKFTLIECILETGRTHQIRVHLSYIGHPVVGDELYGPRKVIGDCGQFLHAKIIGFNHPKTNEYLEFDSEIPQYMLDFMKELEV